MPQPDEDKEAQEQVLGEQEGDNFCGHQPGEVQDLGKATSQMQVLIPAPGTVSVPIIEMIAGGGLLAIAFYLVHNEFFWGIALMLAGFVLLFLGINKFKLQDRRKRSVQLFQWGFVYRVGRDSVEIPFRDIKSAKLGHVDVELRGVHIGVLHELSLSCGGKIMRISSFEHEVGEGPKEIDKFVLWAKKFLAVYKTRH